MADAMSKITTGVEYNVVAREWRFKWSADNDKASLASAQIALNKVLDELKSIDGVKDIQRVICGGVS